MNEPETEKKSWWPFASLRGSKLIEARLVTQVPIDIAVQKLRGFIADHDARVLKITQEDVRLEASDSGAGRSRRAGDRPVTFVIDIHLSEQRHDGPTPRASPPASTPRRRSR